MDEEREGDKDRGVDGEYKEKGEDKVGGRDIPKDVLEPYEVGECSKRWSHRGVSFPSLTCDWTVSL